MVFRLGIYESRVALIFTYPTFLIPFCTWLLMGYFRSIPYELEDAPSLDGASPLADPGPHPPAACPCRADLGRHFRFTLSWNEFIYALTFIQQYGVVAAVLVTVPAMRRRRGHGKLVPQSPCRSVRPRPIRARSVRPAIVAVMWWRKRNAPTSATAR